MHYSHLNSLPSHTEVVVLQVSTTQNSGIGFGPQLSLCSRDRAVYPILNCHHVVSSKRVSIVNDSSPIQHNGVSCRLMWQELVSWRRIVVAAAGVVIVVAVVVKSADHSQLSGWCHVVRFVGLATKGLVS